MVNEPDNTIQLTADQAKPESEKIKDPVLQPAQQASEGVVDAEDEKDRNWRAFREARKKERSDREAAEQRAAEKEREVEALKRAMEAAFAGGGPVRPSQIQNDRHSYQSEFQEESEDERIEKKVQAAIAQRETASEKARAEREHNEYPTKLRNTYSDFEQVVSQENLDYLDYHYPEVSKPLQRLGDGYDKWTDVYKAVKKFVPNNTTSRKEAAKADANFSKPRSMSSSGLSQNTQAPQSLSLSEDRKAENWARMQKAMKSMA